MNQMREPRQNRHPRHFTQAEKHSLRALSSHSYSNRAQQRMLMRSSVVNSPLARGNSVLSSISKLNAGFTSANDAREREANQFSHTSSRQQSKETVPSLSNSGTHLPKHLQKQFSPVFGKQIENIRIHQNAQAQQAASLLGAQAFSHGSDIYLSANASIHDASLLRHELGHVWQNQNLVQLREATWLERRAWLAFFDHYLPRKFLNNYMDDTGSPIILTAQEMQDCNPIVDLRRSRGFMSAVARLQAQGGGTQAISVTGWGGALTNGTLGNFTIHYDGMLAVNSSESWTFSGNMWFEDYWDFNTGGANRPLGAEIKVRVANAFLPGQPFAISSVLAPVSQSDSDQRATWAAATVRHVPDRAGRTISDIAVGDVGGGDVGAEAGAQASEDLN